MKYSLSYYILGRSYDLEENGASQDYDEALKYYKKAFEIIKECADKGHVAAIYDLGANFYYNGNGTEKNLKLSEYYLRFAKEAGLKRAIDKYEEYEFGDER